MPVTRTVITLLATVTLAVGLSAGCAKDESDQSSRRDGGSVMPPPKVANEQNAKEKLRSAEEAERRGDYARAMEGYEQLRSFPEAARPNDLDKRIERLRTKMSASPKR